MQQVTQQAEVVAVAAGQVQVRACAASGCSSCSLAGGCGQGLLARWLLRAPPLLTLPTALILQPGDRVLLAMDAAGLHRAALLQFVLPLLTLLLLALVAEMLGAGALLTGLLALVGLLAGLWLARRLARAPVLTLLHRIEPESSSLTE
ncbi:SoxR reducing system RseC family protein [Marinospirillum alkaliphilum]|uniref:Positive regulator of sigma(E), RseC/MucC n=1 Tax=Marinospirillum alkaliphilum DSM 21637 TaxID=1122209 RepID=A0A1K1YKC6_9GAMM|nr:SoxR reducing system RseC family protein [Marinospirillum alkaliphilum]SFX62286.1 positive regulator of sigma(E), RseC/MucC [Marinospirillum alkaliphilum DSM 21637]